MKSIYRFLTTILAASALLSWSAEAQVADYGEDNGVISFEKGTSPASASRGGMLSISDEHAKLGGHSLKWEWNKPGAILSIKGDIPYLPEKATRRKENI